MSVPPTHDGVVVIVSLIGDKYEGVETPTTVGAVRLLWDSDFETI